jgi:hypothetical protein
MILVNGRNDGRRVNKRITELSRAKEKIVVPPRPTDRKWWQVDQFQENIELHLPYATVDLIVIEGYDGPQP